MATKAQIRSGTKERLIFDLLLEESPRPLGDLVAATGSGRQRTMVMINTLMAKGHVQYWGKDRWGVR